MSVLKEGDGINFQKASYTLDGCVKIYTSRVDSVATETGKLLSGLSDGSNKGSNRNKENEGEEDDDDDEEDEDGKKHGLKSKRKAHHSEVTLAENFQQLHAKKIDLELSVDPLFRKMCADFDEGGARGLLLNSLNIDKTGRVVFDGEADEESEDEQISESVDEPHSELSIEKDQAPESHLDLQQLREKYFPDLNLLEQLEICPSLKKINNVLQDPTLLSQPLINDMDTLDIRDVTNGYQNNEDNELDEDAGAGFDDLPLDMGDGLEDEVFGSINGSTMDMQANSDKSGPNAVYTLVPGSNSDLLAYFDETLHKNWAGPEHWRVTKLKAASSALNANGALPTLKKSRKSEKEKEQLLIDFHDDTQQVDESVIFAEGGSAINLPKSQWYSKNRNLLPDDTHFTSKNLTTLFIKPFGSLTFNIADKNVQSSGNEESKENFWTKQYQGDDQQPLPDYDANFFQDDGETIPHIEGDSNENDIYDAPADYPNTTIAGGLTVPDDDGLSLVNRKARPEYVDFAKTAKRVNVKLLKDNIWKKLELERPQQQFSRRSTLDADLSANEEVQVERKFTEVVGDLKSVYPSQQMSDISTSFCFICVLHLANEKGLIIQNNSSFTDLTISNDFSVSGTELSA